MIRPPVKRVVDFNVKVGVKRDGLSRGAALADSTFSWVAISLRTASASVQHCSSAAPSRPTSQI